MKAKIIKPGRAFIATVAALMAMPVQSANVDWLLSSHAASRADGAVLNYGYERVPGASVQLQTGRLAIDMPEVSLKGGRGLDLVISRSHGKVASGYHSMASWDLESPRLVLTTAPSTKLKGDALAAGICAHTGDVSNSQQGEDYIYTATASGTYASELSKQITSYFISQENKVTAQRLLSTIVTSVDGGILHDETTSNRANAVAGNQAISNNLASSLNVYTQNIITTNNWAEIATLKSQTRTSLIGTFTGDGSGARKIKIRQNNSTAYHTFSNADTLISYLNENFLSSYNILVTNGVVVTDLAGNALPFLGVFARQQILLYLYLNSLQSVNTLASTWVTTQNTTANVYTFDSKVDPRKRPIALYLPAAPTRLFYPVSVDTPVQGFPAAAKYVSQDNWFISCGVGSDKGMTVHASSGVRYYFPESNRENQTGYPSVYKASAFPGRVTVYASAMENVNREAYVFEYENIALGEQPFVGYNPANKLLLKAVRHKLDGALTSGGEPLLRFVYNKFNNGAYSATYTTGSGDIVLRKIQRKKAGAYVDWSTYDYAFGQKMSQYTFNETPDDKSLKYIQDAESSRIYLDKVSYANLDVYTYTYGGPYNITGNFPSVAGDPLSSAQGYLWFFSDLTRVVYSRKRPDGSLVNGYTTSWTYSSFAFSTPGYDDSKHYRLTSSSYSIASALSYFVNYTYPSPANNEQIVTVGLPKGKVHTLTFFSYPKGLNENPLQGFLKSIAQGAKTTTYAWVPSVVIGQMPAAGTSYADSAMASVNRYRKSAETISHHGSYGRSFSAFDEYDNPTLFTEAGLNGGTQISRPIAASYFNSNPLQVMTGSDHWWLLGLQKSVSSNSKNLWAADYDAQGSLTYKIVNGVRTDYAYTPVAFSNCLASLANFQWGSFISCAANYLFGDYHTGLVYEESIGVGLLVTKFAAYEKGVPQRVLLSNGGEEKNEVDDYGNITQHISPTGVISDFKYDPAGELYEETPAVGLAKTSIVRNGFAVTRTVATGAAVHSTTTDTYDGFGRRIISTVTSGGRSIHKRWILDEFGRVGTDVFSADSSNATAGIVYTYDAFDRVLTELNGTASYTYCYQSCGADVGSLIRVSNSLNDQVVVTSYYALGSFSTGLTAKIEQRGADGSSMLTETSYDPSRLVPTSSSRGRSTQSYLYNASRQLERITDNASGIKEFSYDAAGRTKTVTTADGVVETHHYYGLGDLLQKRSLSAGGGEISYEYNLAGQIKKSTSAHAVLDFSRDIYGRIDQLTQTLTLPNQTARPYAVGYGYNSIGQVISLTFPGGKSVDLSNQNAFGHISSIPQIADSLSYDASGNLKTFQRQDISWARAYAANGRLESIVSSGSLRCHYSVAYGYDALHRINKVTDNCGENDNIDLLTRWGTGQIKRVSGGMIAGNAGSFDYTYNHDDVASITRTVGLGAPQAMTFTYQGGGTSPRLGSITSSPYVMAYDAVGRITSDGGSTFTYDGFGRVLTQTDAQSSRLFYYAADNLRVAAKTTTGSNIQETDYVYGLSGELLYELNRTSQLAKHYIHVAGQLLATIETYPDADTDGDGMVDEEEVENGLNPLLAGDTVVDTDGDGLPDWQERLWGLDPTNPDTDGDGANDGDEVNQLGLAAALDSSKKPRVRCLICWLIPVIT